LHKVVTTYLTNLLSKYQTDSPVKKSSKKSAQRRNENDEEALAAMDAEAFASGHFGSVPLSFGGCRMDFFSLVGSSDDEEDNEFDHSITKRIENIEKKEKKNKKEDSKKETSSVFIPLSRLQRSYLPTAFDSTELEWSEVKDFLWLVGVNYKPTLASIIGTENSNNNSNNNSEGSIRSLQHQGEEMDSGKDGMAWQKKQMYHMHQMGIVLNDLQKLFTNVYSLSTASKSADDEDRVKLPHIVTSQKKDAELSTDVHFQVNLLAEEAKRDDCLKWLVDLKIEPPSSLSSSDFYRLVLFARNVDRFVDEFLYICIQPFNAEDVINDITLKVSNGGHKTKSIFLSSSIAAMKKVILSHLYKTLHAFGSQVHKNMTQLIDCGLSSCTARHDNWLLSAILRNLNIDSNPSTTNGQTKSIKAMQNVSFRTVSTVTASGHGKAIFDHFILFSTV